MTLRLSTYNCENLFSRARLLQLADATQRTALLADARAWAAHLSHGQAQAPARPSRALARCIELPPPGTLPGELHYRRSRLDAGQCHAKAHVLREVDADVQCLVEVEDRGALATFNRRLLDNRFPYHLLVEGNDPRGCHLGVLSRLPLLAVRSHAVDRAEDGPLFSRDCLELELALPSGDSLHLLLSQFDGPDDGAGSEARRSQQATAVARLASSRYDLSRQFVAVLGDLNDSPQRAPQCLAPLLRLPGLSDVLALQFVIPDDRWTSHRRRNEQLDYILVSDALRACFRLAGTERRGMPDLERNSIARERPFATRGTASSRAAVWADFELPGPVAAPELPSRQHHGMAERPAALRRRPPA
jgi:endonuclease/exonuclease/phosphatase family metal-dependent hydrolase